MIRFNCSDCERPFKVADEHAGKSIRCPGCKSVIKVPAEAIEEELVEEEPAPPPRKPSRAVKPAEAPPARRKAPPPPVEDDEDDRPRRKARLQEDEEEEETPRRRRRDEDDEDVRPRKKKKNRRKEEETTDAKLFIAASVGLTVLYVALAGLGFFIEYAAYALLIVGCLTVGAGTWWIGHIAQQESDMHYLAVRFVPFYDTWFSLTRWAQTWGACITCWIGRFFVITAVVLLIKHFLHDAGGGRWPPPGGGGGIQTPAQIDAECVDLLRSPDAAEARAWLAAPGRRFGHVEVGQLRLKPAVEGLYQQWAVRVTFADMISDEDGDDPHHIVVELPAEKEKRQALVNYINGQLVEFGDDPASDKGQKYLLVHTTN